MIPFRFELELFAHAMVLALAMPLALEAELGSWLVLATSGVAIIARLVGDLTVRLAANLVSCFALAALAGRLVFLAPAWAPILTLLAVANLVTARRIQWVRRGGFSGLD